MTEKSCSIAGCELVTRIVRGFCTKHYQRNLKHGDPHYYKKNPGGYDMTIDSETGLLNRVIEQIEIDPETGCWKWQGTKVPDGYGSLRHDNRWWSTHRYVYTAIEGDIPAGLSIDHLCRVRSCCNPDHLEPVTHKENMLRARGNRTHCKNGHEWLPANTYITKQGARSCRTCSDASKTRSEARKAALHH